MVVSYRIVSYHIILEIDCVFQIRMKNSHVGLWNATSQNSLISILKVVDNLVSFFYTFFLKTINHNNKLLHNLLKPTIIKGEEK